MSKEAIEHYEAALKEAFPSGATGDVFHHWNEARKTLAEQPAQQALDKMAENARELGLDYEPRAWFTVDELNAWADKKLEENPHWNEAPEKQDIPDLIAGALGVSRGTAYDLMREALASEAKEQLAQPDYQALESALTRLQKRYADLEGKVNRPWAGADECRISLVTAIHFLASDYENALGVFRDDTEARRKAEGDIAYARKIAAKWNWNGASPPPQRTWVGLTDEDWKQIFLTTNATTLPRAIEAKLKEKNQ